MLMIISEEVLNDSSELELTLFMKHHDYGERCYAVSVQNVLQRE